MLVRIRLSSGPKVHRKKRKNRHVALGLASLLIPIAVMAYVLVGWKVAAELEAAGQFPITEGLFSHWQVWMVAAGTLHAAAVFLNRYGKSEPAIQKSVDEPERQLVNSRF
jgi:hypothetical protein